MAAAASSTNKLQNSYFFYGTHPLKVPNTLVHSSSTTSLSTSTSTDPNSTHLSLNLTNSNHYHHGFSSTSDLSTRKSLHHLVNDADENNEVNKKKSFLPYITDVCHCPDNIIVRININI
jgi:hypothetical protein